MILASALMCLAANVYYEARSEPVIGQYAVANVTMNRAGDDPGRVCKVVLERHQFSWTDKKVFVTKRGPVIRRRDEPKEAHAWAVALKIASNTLAGRMIDLTHGATFYHTTAVRPAWRERLQKAVVIGSHIFYRIA